MSLQENNTQLGQDEEDIRMELYQQYGNHVFESLEEFCCRQAEAYGEEWITILKR